MYLSQEYNVNNFSSSSKSDVKLELKFQISNFKGTINALVKLCLLKFEEKSD